MPPARLARSDSPTAMPHDPLLTTLWRLKANKKGAIRRLFARNQTTQPGGKWPPMLITLTCCRVLLMVKATLCS